MGVKGPQEMEEEKDVSHRKTMPLADSKNVVKARPRNT